MVAASKPVAPKPLSSRVRIYKPNEIDLGSISEKARIHLGRTPHEFQTRFFSNVMQGKDVILDIGTGSGKSLCFDLPVLVNKKEIVLVVSPLTALMLEQAGSFPARIPGNLSGNNGAGGKGRTIKASGRSKKVLGKGRLQEYLRLVVVDEAHCVSLWGGSFLSEYADLGNLRGRVPVTTVFPIASATLPAHVLDDVCAKFKIGKDAVTVSMSNARPNIALSVRKIMHPDDTKADLRFLLPNGATTGRRGTGNAGHGPRTSVSRSLRSHFTMQKSGRPRKRELERLLREGKVRILCCTDAMGMGCDMRNIRRVILWKLPPSFCALAQRSGRAVRDFEALGEAILFVSAKVLKDGVAEEQARITREEAADPQNQEGDVFVPETQEGLDVVAGQEVVVGEGGVRVERDAEEDDAEVTLEVQTKKKKRKAARVSFADALEARFLSRFACTTGCRRIVWDEYFDNAKKPHSFFPVELVVVEKIPGLKGGKKRKWPTELSDAIRVGLRKWSREVLMPLLYPKDAGFSMTGSALLPDSTIEQIAMCGERVNSALQQIFDQYDSEDHDESDPPQDIMDMILMGRGRGRGRAQGRGRAEGVRDQRRKACTWVE
ncbi:P-loop containing nucleoside triphosphate hydrolase protein [Mycena olivaceomarginata]|nr:P-loop containing nucleoside triphosphate hydrolase protein [Mycena olivaceomarginata]